MTPIPSAPEIVLRSVRRIYDRLPALVGADWSTIQPEIDKLIRELETQPDADRTSIQLRALLWPYKAAHQALTDAINETIVQATITQNIAQPLAEMDLSADDDLLAALYAGMSWEVDPETVPDIDDDLRTRAITMKDGGASGGRSVKFRNLDIDLSKMMTMSAGFFMTGDSILDKPKPFVIAAGVLMIVGTLLSEMTVKIEQQEATVFWGFITATNDTPKNRQATAKTIFSTTNAERHKRSLPELSDEQFRHSLYKLEQLGSIEKTGDTYRIIERFRIKT